MKLKMNCTYKSRDGKLVTIVEHFSDGGHYPWRGDNEAWFNPDGTIVNRGHECDGDLVELADDKASR